MIQKGEKLEVRVLMRCLYPFFHHKVIGADRLQLDADTPCVFVCNHGEIYGPIITKLYLPFPFRPWVTYEMLDRQAIVDRTCNGVLSHQKVLPPRFCRWLMKHIGAPLITGLMRSVGGIPVYHDQPRKLMQTFRETTAAMERGENILIFPENAATSADGRYQKEGVSEFFTGFTMVGQLYSGKTGKCPLFVPLYSNKKKRRITFGTPTRYRDDLPANEEKERLCAYLRGEMLRIAAEDTEKR